MRIVPLSRQGRPWTGTSSKRVPLLGSTGQSARGGWDRSQDTSIVTSSEPLYQRHVEYDALGQVHPLFRFGNPSWVPEARL